MRSRPDLSPRTGLAAADPPAKPDRADASDLSPRTGHPARLLSALLLAACPTDPGDETGDEMTAATTSNATDAPTGGATDAGATEAATTGGDWMSLDERPCPPDSPLTAENFGGPFMLSNCTGCHHSSLPESERAGAPVGVDFDLLDDVRKQADRIWARAADQNVTMPPLGGPPQDERTRLGEWLACGAPSG